MIEGGIASKLGLVLWLGRERKQTSGTRFCEFGAASTGGGGTVLSILGALRFSFCTMMVVARIVHPTCQVTGVAMSVADDIPP